MQEENIISQFETLKSQINPHFLFNSLNVLSSLIYIDKDKASKFVRQLSKVYRYILDSKDRELITLEDELPFIESYIFLLKTRFDKNLIVNQDLPVDKQHHKIAPMVLQLLIENAIKHNIISKTKPLTIDISVIDNKYLQIKNNLQLKTSTEITSQIGLKNIQKRYEYLCNKKIDIKQTEEYFTVRIPLICDE